MAEGPLSVAILIFLVSFFCVHEKMNSIIIIDRETIFFIRKLFTKLIKSSKEPVNISKIKQIGK